MKYLFWCANEHVDFRIPEISSIGEYFQIPLKWSVKTDDKPYIVIELNSENDALKLASRSFLIKACYELWGEGSNFETLKEDVMNFASKNDIGKYKSTTFKVCLETFGKSVTQPEKISKIESLSYLPLEGKFSMKNYDLRLDLLEFYGYNPNEAPKYPIIIFLGRHLADGQRGWIQKYSLKNRVFLGNTSMDPQLAFFMCNMCLIEGGNLVLDPFVGTGSLLVAAAHFGAFVLGTDIDYLMLHGKTKPSRYNQHVRNNESVRANLAQYKLENKYLDVCVADSSRPLWHPNIQFDAIITDPPYGIREATERVGSIRQYQVSPQHFSSHIPSKIGYDTSDLYQDLLMMAASFLKMNGRIAFWIPVIREDYAISILPSHPCLHLLYDCEQVLTSHSSRRLVIMEKIQQWSEFSEKEPTISCDNPIISEFRRKYFESVCNLKGKRFDKKAFNIEPGVRNKTGQYCGSGNLKIQQ